MNIAKTIGMIALGTGILLVNACSSDNNITDEPKEVVNEQNTTEDPETPQMPGYDLVEIHLSPKHKAALNATNKMAFDLLANSLNLEDKDQVCISPVSALNLLSMVANGVSDADLENFIQIFGMEDSADKVLEAINSTCNDVVKMLPFVSYDVNLSLTNSLWLDNSMAVNPDYNEVLINNFGGEVVNQYPGGISGMQKINEWVSRYTNGMISPFLEEPLNINVALLNTVYFKGSWKYGSFREEATKPADFIKSDGSKVSTEFMNTLTYVGLAENDAYTMVSLPFKDKNFEMSFIMPSQEIGLQELSESDWNELNSSAREDLISLSLPKFEFSDGYELDKLIEKQYPGSLGNSRFTRILANETELNGLKVLQKAKIKVDEKGCEAAAATMGGFITLDGPDEPQFREIRFDHPFYFVLHEKTTGAILFLGKIKGF